MGIDDNFLGSLTNDEPKEPLESTVAMDQSEDPVLHLMDEEAAENSLNHSSDHKQPDHGEDEMGIDDNLLDSLTIDELKELLESTGATDQSEDPVPKWINDINPVSNHEESENRNVDGLHSPPNFGQLPLSENFDSLLSVCPTIEEIDEALAMVVGDVDEQQPMDEEAADNSLHNEEDDRAVTIPQRAQPAANHDHKQPDHEEDGEEKDHEPAATEAKADHKQPDHEEDDRDHEPAANHKQPEDERENHDPAATDKADHNEEATPNANEEAQPAANANVEAQPAANGNENQVT